MACFKPLSAWQTESGMIIFVERGKILRALELPCGQCIGCRIARSEAWATRIMHEASLHDENSFLTLTYDDDHVRTSLVYKDFQAFCKKARRKIGPFRFYMCGEYGDRTIRPHFHACIFGQGFYLDRYEWRKSAAGAQCYRSPLLETCWQNGNCEIGNLTYQSAAYVARYCMKKVTGNQAEEHYESVDIRTGEIIRREPEFSRMSLKPGIGMDWIRLYHDDFFSQRSLLVDGKRKSLPRFYKKYLANTLEYDNIMNEAMLKAYESPDNTPKRLADREKCTIAKVSKLVRTLE